MPVPVPNFLIIGPPKCGTTALYGTLAGHPQVFMSRVKEPYFFAFEDHPPAFAGPGAEHYRQHAVTDWESYQALFAGADGYAAIGEASPLYLTHYQPAQTAEAIRRRLPDVRLVAVLRQPAERAYSQFTYRRQQGHEPLRDFAAALAAEDQRIAANWSPACRYRRNGAYFSNLTPYFERFPREQLRIYLYDDLKDRPAEMLADLCAFLHLDPALMPGTVAPRNVTIWQRSQALGSLLRQPGWTKALLPTRLRRALGSRLRAWNRVKPPALEPALRADLTLGYREELLRLQDLIGRDLGHWLVAP